MNGLAASGCQLAIILQVINFADNNDHVVCQFDLTDFFSSELCTDASDLMSKFSAMNPKEIRELLFYTCLENDLVQNMLCESFLDTYALFLKNKGRPFKKARLEAAEIGFLVAGCVLIVDGIAISIITF